MEKEKTKLKCAFCGKEFDVEEKIMIQSLKDSVYICEECIEQAHDIIKEMEVDEKEEIAETLKDFKKPSEIYKFLNEYVVGQDRAKKILSVAVYNHYKAIKYKQSKKKDKVDIQKSNILLLGPTGVGKTYLVQTLAKILDVPLAIQDATSLTEAGYVGEDVENCVRKLIENANYDIKKAEKGIIYIDEIDKLSRKGANPSITRDVSGEGVQQTLLKIIEGDVIEVPTKSGRKNPVEAGYKIDTSNILFICGGSFEGIEKIVEKRTAKNSLIGFGSKNNRNDSKKQSFNELFQQIKSEDIKNFGLIPELLGRLPIICTLEELDEKALIQILTEPKNAIIKQYKELLDMDNVQLKFDEKALKAIAQKAIKTKTGARSLRGIIEECLLDHMFYLPEQEEAKEIIITKDCITKNKAPKIIKERVV